MMNKNEIMQVIGIILGVILLLIEIIFEFNDLKGYFITTASILLIGASILSNKYLRRIFGEFIFRFL